MNTTDDNTRPFGYWITAVDRLMRAEFATVFEDEGITRRDWRMLNRIDGTVPDGRPVHPRKLHRLIDNAMQGAQRGASLTQRMLAFARRQELKADTVDVSQLVGNMTELLSRSLGPTIQMETYLTGPMSPVLVDANQLELAILNLAVNAKDAMPQGGTLTISADEAEPPPQASLRPGRYIRLSLSDTGTGMDEGTLAHATERAQLATMVTCPIVRYHPAIVAQMAATVGVMSEGRFTLGLGAGERLNEHVVGKGWPSVDVRHEMLDEAIDVIDLDAVIHEDDTVVVSATVTAPPAQTTLLGEVRRELLEIRELLRF